jgi:light-regulated signal transduction histidine kinase (bacteriophytochrome)
MTEEKIYRLNQQLLDNNVHLKQVNEELDQFAYMASHDLQEPLRKIQIFSDKISSKATLDDESSHHFSRIINASRRMQRLINNLLEYSRHSVNSSDFQKTDLNLLVKDTLGELEIDIEKSHAQISYQGLPVISAVPDLMQRLFYNLLSNAIKFRKEEVPLVVKIEAQEIKQEDGYRVSTSLKGKNFYKIIVSDNGIGFDDRQSQEIFKVFKRLNSYQQYEGTGVGLAICKKIIEKHGGFIKAESIPDQGSSFIIGLPESQPSRIWDYPNH